MATTDVVFAGAIPETYDRLLVPMLFEPFAADLALRLAAVAPRKVLETAAGTGAVTRAIAAKLPEAEIVATDLNEGMLYQARSAHAGDGRVAWRQADALDLPFEDGAFDAVVCQFGVMFFPDRIRGYREALRVLRPGGLFLFNAWDRISENGFPATVAPAIAELFPHNPPDFMARIPHGYHDAGRIRADLQEAGFGRISVSTVTAISRAGSAEEVAVAFCQGTPLRAEIEARDPSGLPVATAHAAEALRERFGDGPIEGQMQALVVAASQQP